VITILLMLASFNRRRPAAPNRRPLAPACFVQDDGAKQAKGKACIESGTRSEGSP
jgi:hypothetical protein